MATKALTYLAPRVRRDQVSFEMAPRHERGWRELLTEEDADAIWKKISRLVRSNQAKPRAASDLTQEIFLHLLTSGRFDAYIELGFSEEEIDLDILACLPE